MAINLKKDVFEEDIIKPEVFKPKDDIEKPINTAQPINLEKTQKPVEVSKFVNRDVNINVIETETQTQNTASTNRVKITGKSTNVNEDLKFVKVRLIYGNKKPEKKGFFNTLINMDCDLCAILLGADGTIIGFDGVDSCVYWGNKNYSNNAVFLKGDQGGSEVYMEDMHVNTSRLPDNVHSVVFAVNIDLGYVNKLSFGLASALELYVFDSNTKEQIECIEIANRFRSFNGLICCSLTKVNDKWKYSHIGQPLANVTTIADILKKFI